MLLRGVNHRRLKKVIAISLAAYVLCGGILIVQNHGPSRVVIQTFPAYCAQNPNHPECTSNLLLAEATVFDWPQWRWSKTINATDYTYVPIDLVLAGLLAGALTLRFPLKVAQ
jgi:hypothetical protein